MRRVGWVVALLVVIGCVFGLRYASRQDEATTAARPMRAERGATVLQATELPTISSEVSEAASSADLLDGDNALRKVVPGEPIEGVVFGAPRDRLNGADVALFRVAAGAGANSESLVLLERAVSNVDGRFRFTSEWAPDLKITASFEGYDEGSIVPELDCTARIVLPEHELRATIRGRIITSRGSPPTSCRQTLRVRSLPRSRLLDSSCTKLDDDGTFELVVKLSDDGPLHAYVSAESWRCRSGRSGRLEFAAGAVVEGVLIEVEEATAILHGSVLEEQGEAVDAATIWGVPQADVMPLAMSTADGTFEAPLFEPDLLTALVIKVPGFAPTYLDLPSPSERSAPVIVRMSRGATVSGRVDFGGRGGRAVAVWCSATHHDQRESTAPKPYWIGAAEADENGKYAIEHVPLGDVQVWLTVPRLDRDLAEQTELLHVESASIIKDFVVQ